MSKVLNKQRPHISRSSFDIYRTEMRHELLTADEERALARKSVQGDVDARNALVCRNLRLVVSVARTYSWSPVPFEELVQEGNIGLMRAAEIFDPSLGVRFSTYAMWWIKSSIFRALSESSLVRIPESTRKETRQIGKVEYRLMMETGKPVSDAQIATELNLSEWKVRELRGGIFVGSMDSTVSGDSDMTLHDTIQDLSATDNVTNPIEYENLIERVLELFDGELVPKAKRACIREVFERAYGLCGREEEKLPEIAKSMNMPRMRVSSYLETAHRVIRHSGGNLF